VIDIEAAVPLRSGFFCLAIPIIGVSDNNFGDFQLSIHASKAFHHIAVSFSAVVFGKGATVAHRDLIR
jgi:hypothetical protein